MTNKVCDIQKVRDAMRCIFEQNSSIREASRLSGLSRCAVSKYVKQLALAEMTWELIDNADEIKLASILNPPINPLAKNQHNIDFGAVHEELKQKGATLAVLHDEWLSSTPDENHISYSHFCRAYTKYKKSLRISLRLTHVYGEMALVDYAGKTVTVTYIHTGEERTAQIFIGVLGGSNYTFCEATWSQKLRDWIESHGRMFEYFQGVPKMVVHDNLKSAVTKADRVSPILNESYRQMCRHYGTYPFPARALKPKDKPQAEGAVLLVSRWILFRLRKHKFFSLAELNGAIQELLVKLNARPFQKLPGSRLINWQTYEKAALQPLEAEKYQFAEYGVTRAGLDYHVCVDRHYYSVPYHLREQQFNYRLTPTSLELIYKGKCIVTHQRSFEIGAATTLDAHRPPAHSAVAGWTQENALNWANSIGPSTSLFLETLLNKVNNYLMGYRIEQAIKRLQKTFGDKRLEQAAFFALQNKVTNSEGLRKILSGKLDLAFRVERTDQEDVVHDKVLITDHKNIRGADYYSQLLQGMEV